MSIVIPHFEHSKIVRAAEAEVLGASNVKVHLLADSSDTGGALSTVRVSLNNGSDGARPHRHEKSAEMFYILDGRVQLLSGLDIVTAEAGDVIVVPPRTAHAFAAERGSDAELLIVIAPGVERFEYFRKLTRIARGEEPPETLGEMQEIYDNYFLNSPEWQAARA
jgi:mannose-6-phosphate isomerase-like protein (cupin superfamily)